MAPHYTDSEVMAIFMAGGAAATRDGRQSVERMERLTAKEYPVQVDPWMSCPETTGVWKSSRRC